MIFLIDKKEIIKCLVGCPTGYVSTGKKDMPYTLYNGDIIILHTNPKINDISYGKIRYDTKRKEYYIDFDIFSPVNKHEYNNIYFSEIECKPLTEDGKDKKIVGLNIDKTFLFPIKHMHLIYEQYTLTAHQYEDCLFILETYGEDAFEKKILEEYVKGLLDIPLGSDLIKQSPDSKISKKELQNDNQFGRAKDMFDSLLEIANKNTNKNITVNFNFTL